MTAVERAYVRRLTRRAQTMEPSIARRYIEAYELIRRNLSEAELVEAIRSGQLDRLIYEILEGERLDPLLMRLRIRVDQVVMDAARLEAAHGLPSSIRTVFNVLSPHVVEAVRKLDTRVVEGLKNEVRETVRQAAEQGLREGLNPRSVARRVRSVIGLAPNQEAAIGNFRRMLVEGDREALTRTLRDKRFDRTLQKALGKNGTGLSPEQIEKMTTAYRKRMVAFNAETQARTLALDAQKLGQRLAWQDAIERGIVSRNDLRREWIAVGGPQGDGRNRPEHLAMHGETRGFDEPFSNGELIPGDSTYNCRCVDRVVLQRARAVA